MTPTCTICHYVPARCICDEDDASEPDERRDDAERREWGQERFKAHWREWNLKTEREQPSKEL